MSGGEPAALRPCSGVLKSVRMSVKTKICGVSTPEAERAALDGGAASLGFTFFEKSPRKVAPEAAARLAQPVRGRARVVALCVDPTDAEADRIARGLQP